MSNLPPDWSVAELRSAAGSTPDSFIDGDWIEAPYITNQGIRLIQTGNIGRASFLDKADTQKCISRASFRLLNCKWVNAGDLLICRLADPIGRACEIPASVGEAITSVDCTIFRVAASRFDKRFVLHWLNSDENLKNALDKAAGSTRSRISRSNLGQLPIPQPDLNEQGLIAQILDTLDTAIHETEAIIAKLKAVKQGLLHDLLTRGIDANGELRPPQAEAPHLYKESPLGWIPFEWTPSSVEAEFFVDSGITLGQHRVPRNNPRPYLRVANVHRAKLRLEDIAFLEASDSEAAEKSLQQGDLLVVEGHASTEEIGRCAMANQTVCGLLFQNHLFRLRPRRLLNTFALLWMNSGFVRAYWRTEAATSSGLNTINRTKLNRLSVAVPCLHEQECIATIIANIDNRICGEEATLEKLRSQKSGLMDDLLTGRVRVTPLLGKAAQQQGNA